MNLWVPALLLMVAACSSEPDRPQETAGTGSYGSGWNEPARPLPQAKGEAPGTVFSAEVDRDAGALKVALPGGRFEIDVPKDSLRFEDFDIDGTKLYPGTTVDSINVEAGGTASKDDATVRIRFTAPAAPDVVRAWYLSETAGNARPLTLAGDMLAGSTKDGKAYRITFTPAATGGTTGEILVNG